MSPLFKYHTKDKSGSDKDGVVEASDEKQAVEKLESMGLTVILLEEMKQEDKTSSDKTETQICPHCKETIKKGAEKCPHCQSSLFYLYHHWLFIGMVFGGLLSFILPHPDILTKEGGINFDNMLKFVVNIITWMVIGTVIGGICEVLKKLKSSEKTITNSAVKFSGKFTEAKLTVKCFIIGIALCLIGLFINVALSMFNSQSLGLWDFSRNLLVVGLSLTIITGIIKKFKK